MKKIKFNFISFITMLSLIVGIIAPATSVAAENNTLQVSKYVTKENRTLICGANSNTSIYEGVWTASVPMTEVMKPYEGKMKTAAAGFLGRIPYPHSKDVEKQIAYVEYNVQFPQGVVIQGSGITTDSHSVMFPKAGIKYSVDNNNVKFKIPLTDENWKGVYNKYQEDMNNNPETRTVDLKIPFTIYAGNQTQADAYQNKEIVGTGDFTFNTKFLGATTYLADKSVISLADLFSTCFPKKAEKVNVTFNPGNQAEFVDGDKNPKVIEIEKGQVLTDDQLPKVKAKEGYVFNGWSILDNTGGLTGAFNNTNPINDNLNLIANCSPKTPISK